MSRKHKQRKVSENKQKIARITKKRLAFLIVSLLAILALFILKPGVDLWPIWMTEYRKGLIAVMGFVTLLLIFMSPIIVITESDPRPLSGPGKNPKTGSFFDG